MKLKFALPALAAALVLSTAALAADEYNVANGLTLNGNPLGMHGIDPVSMFAGATPALAMRSTPQAMMVSTITSPRPKPRSSSTLLRKASCRSSAASAPSASMSARNLMAMSALPISSTASSISSSTPSSSTSIWSRRTRFSPVLTPSGQRSARQPLAISDHP